MYYVDPNPGPAHRHDVFAVALAAAQYLADTTGRTHYVRGPGTDMPVPPRQRWGSGIVYW